MHISNLPPELHIEIFHQAKSSAPFDFGGSTAIMSISQVCGTWRSIALDSPALWNDIRLSPRSSLSKLGQLSSRSKGSLISVAVDCTTSSCAPKLEHYWALLHGLSVHRDRICALDVIAPTYVLSLLSQVLLEELPQLRSLHVVQESEPHPAPDEPVVHKVHSWSFFPFAPHLQSLSITAITPTHYSYCDLQELEIKESGYFLVHRFPATKRETPLAHFMKLKRLSIISSPLPVFREPPTNTRIVSFTLSKLRTADIPPDTLARFLSTLRMPSLAHLAIDSLHGYLWDEFVQWLPGAKYPALQSVTLESIALAGIDERCLRSFASVSTLRLIDMDPLPILRLLESNPHICPEIRKIDIGNGRLGISGRG
ncbi:hypothetical protein B0H11DRAFT_1149545 [Mycena galericulata]|nr:hypothetical protein B0H11DRAFT_1149545 [Mycena galericulata]